MSINLFKPFWSQYPALFYGIALYLGYVSAFQWSIFLCLPIFLLGLPLLIQFNQETLIRTILVYLVLNGAFFYGKQMSSPPIPPKGISGTAMIDISSFSATRCSFGKKWIYKGHILRFFPDNAKDSILSHLPYMLTLKHDLKKKHPPANQAYLVHGILKSSSRKNAYLMVKENAVWNPIKGTWSLAQFRYQMKCLFSQYLRQHIPHQKSAIFLNGIATGEFDDPLMIFELSRFGLQHIMAISGFHFAIVAAVINLVLRLIFRTKLTSFLLILFLTSYFIFLGCTPSIMRAWITALLMQVGILLNKSPSGLNSLGISLIIILMIDPCICQNLGFQLSFLTTAAILLFFPTIDFFLQKVFLKRRLSQAIEMNLLNQHGYCVLSFLRQGLALGICVNLVSIPTLLYFFHKFPLISLVYNLFFPFLVSISLLLLILGMLTHLIIPPLAVCLHLVNSSFTHFILGFIYHIPVSLEAKLYVSAFPTELIIFYLSLVFFFGIILHQRQREKMRGAIKSAGFS